jgi:hypothetical protein
MSQKKAVTSGTLLAIPHGAEPAPFGASGRMGRTLLSLMWMFSPSSSLRASARNAGVLPSTRSFTPHTCFSGANNSLKEIANGVRLWQRENAGSQSRRAIRQLLESSAFHIDHVRR